MTRIFHRSPCPLPRRKFRPSPRWMAVLLAASLSACAGKPSDSGSGAGDRPTNYDLYMEAAFNDPVFSFYASTYRGEPAAAAYADTYQPVGEWTGRLILPRRSERQPQEEFVWFEVQQAPAPYEDWVNSWVRLQWSQDSAVQDYVEAVTVDVAFNDAARASQRKGNVHPTRLNGLESVGPLESLAGARPADTVVVMLQDPVVQTAGDGEETPVLEIAQDPVQITGRWMALVQVLGPVLPPPTSPDEEEQAQEPEQASLRDRVWVRHYNKATGQFDGPMEQVRIPQVPADRTGVHRSTTAGLEDSPLNDGGWYVYGDRDAEGLFVVQALEPRRLMHLETDQVIPGSQGFRFIRQEQWANTPRQKGSGSTVLLDSTASTSEASVQNWRVGDRAIVLHVFGGIGGEKAESQLLWTTTGHFSYGVAEVIQDPLTDQPRFRIEYYQVYAHNPEAIVAGTIHWADYMGNLQRGWMGTRPVSDVLVKLDTVTDPYQFGSFSLDPLEEFTRQLRIMTARYRTGDGTGAAIVTPATSCVQDSNQALYATILNIQQRVSQSPDLQEWFDDNPQHPEAQRFQRLLRLGRMLEEELVPLGIVRADWDAQAEALAGIAGHAESSPQAREPSILEALKSWRTILPRRAHDEVSQILLDNGAQLWIIRTNQIGGEDDTIEPRPPTTLLGF